MTTNYPYSLCYLAAATNNDAQKLFWGERSGAQMDTHSLQLLPAMVRYFDPVFVFSTDDE
ncbi:MAG: hypothetical protein RMK00_09490 [Bacteroidota bacterium]|nr:hypothetical protein [Bacteroidota bacterium]